MDNSTDHVNFVLSKAESHEGEPKGTKTTNVTKDTTPRLPITDLKFGTTEYRKRMKPESSVSENSGENHQKKARYTEDQATTQDSNIHQDPKDLLDRKGSSSSMLNNDYNQCPAPVPWICCKCGFENENKGVRARCRGEEAGRPCMHSRCTHKCRPPQLDLIRLGVEFDGSENGSYSDGSLDSITTQYSWDEENGSGRN